MKYKNRKIAMPALLQDEVDCQCLAKAPANDVENDTTVNMDNDNDRNDGDDNNYVDAENNEVIKQLLLSEKVWVVTGDLFNPVNVSSSGVEYKTRQRNRLIDYEIDFNYAYNEVNNV